MQKTSIKQKTMKALILENDLSFSVKEVPIPKPLNGQVLVKVMAAPINPSDIAFLKGLYSSNKPSPCIPGLEGSGLVVQNGGGVMGWGLVGKRVAVVAPSGFTGTYGQYVVVSSQEVLPIPSEVSFESGAMSFVNPLTAMVMLDKVKGAGVKAIVHTAAASSLGRMMNKLFATEKVAIINVVRRDEQVELLKKEGAKYVLNSETETFEKDLERLASQLKATVCYDAVGGSLTSKILTALPKGSTLELYGAMSAQPTISNIAIKDLLFDKKTIKGFWLSEEMESMGMLKKLNLLRKLQGYLKKELKSVINKECSLESFQEALDYYMSHMTEGKIIVRPWCGSEESKEEKKSVQQKDQTSHQKTKQVIKAEVVHQTQFVPKSEEPTQTKEASQHEEVLKAEHSPQKEQALQPSEVPQQPEPLKQPQTPTPTPTPAPETPSTSTAEQPSQQKFQGVKQ